MNQTAYTGINNLIKGLPMIGGFCKFWYIPLEEVDAIPPIDPANQVLDGTIVLKEGKAWRGPVPVPDKQLGFTENARISKSGVSYEIKVSCQYPGDIPGARVNFDNMAYSKYIIVGKLRATGFYVLIGSLEAGADFSADFDSGSAAGNPALNKIAWTHEQINKALVIATFEGDQSGYINFPYWLTEIGQYWELE